MTSLIELVQLHVKSEKIKYCDRPSMYPIPLEEYGLSNGLLRV